MSRAQGTKKEILYAQIRRTKQTDSSTVPRRGCALSTPTSTRSRQTLSLQGTQSAWISRVQPRGQTRGQGTADICGYGSAGLYEATVHALHLV